MNQPSYLVARWPHGWTLNAPPLKSGVPISALNEVMPLFERGSVMDPGISHHLRTSGHPEVIEAIATPEEAALWREEIQEILKTCDPEEVWWRGTDTGTSSAAIFSVFCHPKWRAEAKDRGRGSWPRDSADLGRCLRLLALFPEWEKNLSKVAEAYPDNAWPKIIAQWDTLKSVTPQEQSKILRDI